MRVIKKVREQVRRLAAFMCLCLILNMNCIPAMGEELTEAPGFAEESIPEEGIPEEAACEESAPAESAYVCDIAQEPSESQAVSEDIVPEDAAAETLSEDAVVDVCVEEEASAEVIEEAVVSEDSLSAPEPEAPVEETLNAGTSYVSYLPTGTDDDAVLKGKQVSFNGLPWYIISDNSTSATAGSVTLFAVDSISQCKFGQTNTYKGSTIQQCLNKMTDADGSFSNVAGGINSVSLSDVEVSDAKLYLLSENEATALPKKVRACSAFWWLRTPGTYLISQHVMVVRPSGDVFTSDQPTNALFGVRPALQLDLSKVEFNSTKKSFYLTDTENYTVTFKVKNGSWNDGTRGDKTVPLSRHKGEDLLLTLRFGSRQLPHKGSRPRPLQGKGHDK